MSQFGPIVRFDIEDFSGNPVATIWDYISLNIDIVWCGKGNYQISLSGYDFDRIEKFIDDYQVKIWYRDLNFGIDWTNIFTGFIKTKVRALFENGNRGWQSFGPSLEELLDKEYIFWYTGSSQAKKSGIASIVMGEYVYENIGPNALASLGRDADGVVTGLSQFIDGSGPTWSGSKQRKPLLKTLQEIRNFTINQGDIVDFRIISTGAYTWQFQAGKLGVDRTTVGLDKTTGLNGAGNVPVTFSEGQGNILSFTRSKSRTNAITQVVALGEGELQNRAVAVEIDAAGLVVSPIARRSATITANTSDLTELSNAAKSRLEAHKPDDKFIFQPRDVGDKDPNKGGTVLFRDYNVGDFITAIDQGDVFHKQVIGVSLNVSRGESTSITRTVRYADV